MADMIQSCNNTYFRQETSETQRVKIPEEHGMTQFKSYENHHSKMNILKSIIMTYDYEVWNLKKNQNWKISGNGNTMIKDLTQKLDLKYRKSL